MPLWNCPGCSTSHWLHLSPFDSTFAFSCKNRSWIYISSNLARFLNCNDLMYNMCRELFAFCDWEAYLTSYMFNHKLLLCACCKWQEFFRPNIIFGVCVWYVCIITLLYPFINHQKIHLFPDLINVSNTAAMNTALSISLQYTDSISFCIWKYWKVYMKR